MSRDTKHFIQIMAVVCAAFTAYMVFFAALVYLVGAWAIFTVPFGIFCIMLAALMTEQRVNRGGNP